MVSTNKTFQYPGMRQAMDGNTAVIMVEREASDAAGAYPITPSTQMGEYWSEEVAKGHINISDKPLIFVEPESEHAAAAVTAGMAMTGLRATNFSSAQGVAFMHESLYAAAGKRLPYVLNIGCRAITKASLNVHCAHDDYHCIDDTGFIQLMAKSAQEAADLNLIGRKIAELSLTPAVVAQDGFLTTHLIESLHVPERELVKAYLGRPDDMIDTPTPAQRLIYGAKRRRIPAIWDVDNPMQSGTVQNQDAYMQAVAAQRPFFYQHVSQISDQAMDEFYELTGRPYQRIETYKTEDADYVIVGQGSMVVQAEAVADYLRNSRKLKVGVVNITMFRPFPGELIGQALKGKKGVVVLERSDQPLAEDLPLMREVRAAIGKCLENNLDRKDERGEEIPYPTYPAYNKPTHTPRLYSGCFGLGSRDLQPEGIVGAVENMLPGGAKKKFFYLSVDFIRDQAASPQQEIQQQNIVDVYPAVKQLAVHGSENPNLMPENSITVRMHSVGGWGAMTTGKNLALTLFDLLGYDIKANPKYGSEKKGQPTTYYLAAAPEPIRVNCEYHYVDVVMSPDPNVFHHSNPLYGLDKGGAFIIQSNLGAPDAVWRSFPKEAQRFIVEHNIRVFFIDGFKIAREEASDVELQYRMQGNAFQGAFFAASGIMDKAIINGKKLDEKSLFKAIEDQLNVKFGSKGQRVVDDNLRIVSRGFHECQEIRDKYVHHDVVVELKPQTAMPVMLKRQADGNGSVGDIHRFWSQTGSLYRSGKGNDNLADPYIGLSLVPAATGVFRDMTQIRFEYPEWVAENCTGCGDCYTVCPDSAIPGLVNTISEVFNTAIYRIESKGQTTHYLRRYSRTVEKKLRSFIELHGENSDVSSLLDHAVLEAINEAQLDDVQHEKLKMEFAWFIDALGHFQFAVTKPYYTNHEKKAKGSGGLFSVTINPYTCKGCMECINVCDDDALREVQQTDAAVDTLKKDWEFWLDLPSTAAEYIRIDDLDERIGALETLLLNKPAYNSMVCGDGACVGCGEKSVIHLFTSTVTALMQPRVKQHMVKLDGLIEGLEHHIRLRLAKNVNLSDVAAIHHVVETHLNDDLTLSELSAELDHDATPLDSRWLDWATQLLDSLRHLKDQYSGPASRTDMGIINATGCTSVWGSTFPYNPYPFPWTSHLFQDSPSVAMGIFEGHMAKMAEGFKTVRMAELELNGSFNHQEHDDFFRRFSWKDFSEEEYLLCPPVVSIGGDGAMYDIGFQNLSRMMMSGVPVKVLVLDTQVYSNTGGQACTSGFMAQVSDMAPFGKTAQGKEEIRKEMSLIAMAHRTSYVLQSAISSTTHLLEGFIEGLNSRRPAIFNIYSVCQPEHGVPDHASHQQSKLAVESRAYPLFKFNPDAGVTFKDCIDLSGNPAIDDEWPTYSIHYGETECQQTSVDLPMTFADFALTEGRFRKHFRKAPRDTWNESMIPLHEYLHLNASDREDRLPYILAVDSKNHLSRVMVSGQLVKATEERRDFWLQLKSLSGDEQAVDIARVAEEARVDMAQKLTSSLLALASGGGNLNDITHALSATPGQSGAKVNTNAQAPCDDYEPVWIDTPECTSCDECIEINARIFAYDDHKHAYIVDPKAGTYKDIVRAAEKCTAGAIHPGTPFNRSEKDIDKWMQRAAKYN
ncbi:MAG: 2-oxoacid:acceptor oxidoreductase family protein [Gammaproteobacteria bacterium]|nr:2-oxoacid:acceptor oxidoreductase family protein [Gammaproteobacteria bacterium]